jgi:SAM-dependent methyltransferase
MNAEFMSFAAWLDSPAGAYMLDWEQAQFDQVVGDMFGYHALQIGLPQLDALRHNRMPHRWLAAPVPDLAGPAAHRDAPDLPRERALRTRAALVADASALPFAANSLDLVVLAHTLELASDPHGALREVERVLVPEGRVVISSLNPTSLWGMRQRRARIVGRLGYGTPFLPEAGDLIGYWRLRDWLRLLSFEVESGRFGCYRPALTSQTWINRHAWMDKAGARWWPIFGAVYLVVAVKRVRGARLLGPSWKARKALAAAPAAVASNVIHYPPGQPFQP